VKKAIELSTGREVAIKILKINKVEDSRKIMLESFFKEITILSYCKHPNIVKLLYSSFNGTLIKEATPLRKCSVEHSAIETINTESREDADNLDD
jgi:serine/threonine protein kinase